MKEVLSFLVYVALTLIAFLGAWFALKSYGEGQPISTFQTPLVEKLVELSQKDSLTWTKNGPQRLTLHADYKNSQWVAKTANHELPLGEALNSKKFNYLLLFFDLRSPLALPALRDIFKQNQLWKKTIFCSRADGILKDLRALEPEWTFCSGEVFMTRGLALTSLQLESLLDFSADVLFIHLNNLKPSDTLHNLIAEARRRKKFVLMGPVPRPLNGFNPHGWMVVNEDQKDSHQ